MSRLGENLMKLISFWSAGVCAVVIAVAVSIALIGSTAKAQNGWGDDAAQSGDAKKPPPPPPLAIAGNWTGTIQDSKQGPGTVAITFTEKASKVKGTLKGTWSISFPATAPLGAFTDIGTETGSATATAVALTLASKKGDKLAPCKLIFTSVSASQDAITGTYRVSGCKTGNTGTITIATEPLPSTVSVKIGDDNFTPLNLTITHGQTVHWTNMGGEPHTVTANPGTEKCKPTSSEDFESSNTVPLNPGDTFDHTFNTPGTYAYHCEVHGCFMKGTVTVN
jgi:plastocyanin